MVGRWHVHLKWSLLRVHVNFRGLHHWQFPNRAPGSTCTCWAEYPVITPTWRTRNAGWVHGEVIQAWCIKLCTSVSSVFNYVWIMYVKMMNIYIILYSSRMGYAYPFVSSSPTPHITINFSTTAPQHMLSSSQMSCPITFPNLTLTHFTFNFPPTIFLVIHSLFFPMFIPAVLIHDPNFLLIFLCPAFPIPQANIASRNFLPCIIQALSNIHIFYIVSSQLLLLPFHSQYASWFSNALPTLISWYYAYKLRNKFPYISYLEFHLPYP